MHVWYNVLRKLEARGRARAGVRVSQDVMRVNI